MLSLVQNAVKFTQVGGLIINVDFTKQTCPSDSKCGVLVTTVKDSGQGIDEQTQKTLFQIFRNTETLKHEGIIRKNGVGIGLTICKYLVKFMNGII